MKLSDKAIENPTADNTEIKNKHQGLIKELNVLFKTK